ncbi:Rrp15p-domain-containing protein [Sporodiniella umbellata]|nr:Rrp15p-domain-containing protein [Sporodiniella umbellata]
MCKSSTLAFVLLFAFIFKLEKITWQLILIITIITSGVILMVSDETDFSFIGFVQVMSAAAFGGLRWSLTEILLRKESMGLTNPFASIFFLAPIQAAILLILSAIVEGFITIFKSSFFLTFSEGLDTMSVILLGSGVSFVMIVSEFFLIKRTSVVTLSVCGIFKEAATIFISCVTFGDILTPINIIGLCITLFGIGLYNWLKFKKTQEPVESNQKAEPHPMYNNVAESTPMLLVNTTMAPVKKFKKQRKVVEKPVEESDSEEEVMDLEQPTSEESGSEDDLEMDEADIDDMSDDEEEEEGDEFDSSEVNKTKTPKKYSSEAFSDAMAKMLASSLKGNEKNQPILARSKNVERKIEDEKLDYKARKILSAQKKAEKERGRIIPDYTTFDYEKKLRKVATRGVVKLFNAIRTQQKVTEVAVYDAKNKSKSTIASEKAREASTLSKSNFLDLLKAGKQ